MKNVEPYSTYGGNPSKKIRNWFENDEDLEVHKLIVNVNTK